MNVLTMPGVRREEQPGLNLSAQEVVDASGGYVRPADQLRALHQRGFSRAFRRKDAGPVILERAHYDAVVRGQYGGAPAANEPSARAPMPPDRAALRRTNRPKAGA